MIISKNVILTTFFLSIFRLSDGPLKRRFETKKFNRPMNQMASHVAAFNDFDSVEESGYLEIPPPLPPRNKLDTTDLQKCCNSAVCECYLEL